VTRQVPHVGLNGYFGSYLYLDASLRSTFALAPSMHAEVTRYLRERTPKRCSIWVGMHVRRGDKVGAPWEPSAGLEYLATALRVMRRRLEADGAGSSAELSERTHRPCPTSHRAALPPPHRPRRPVPTCARHVRRGGDR
jgi:hypothetical protein